MRFLVDAQLPPALARWIAGQGHPATHVADIGFQTATDSMIWERAASEAAVIVSKNEDFVDHRLMSRAPGQLVWIRRGNCANRELLEWIGALWPEVLQRLAQGEEIIELRA